VAEKDRKRCRARCGTVTSRAPATHGTQTSRATRRRGVVRNKKKRIAAPKANAPPREAVLRMTNRPKATDPSADSRTTIDLAANTIHSRKGRTSSRWAAKSFGSETRLYT